jgi:CRP/FNR family transcriptional regulator, cyclic AMP receptor protein
MDTDKFTPNELEIIKKSNLFCKLTDADFLQIIKMAKRIEAQTGEIILKENEESDMLYILLDGSIKLYKTNEEDLSQCVITNLNAGESLGEMRLVESRSCSLSAVANEELNLFALSISQLNEINNSHILVQLLHQIIAILNKRLEGGNKGYASQVLEKQKIKRKFSFALLSTVILVIIFLQSAFIIYYLMNADNFKRLIHDELGWSNSTPQIHVNE